MKKVLGIAMLMFLVAGAGAFAATTAVDTVGTVFSAATGNIALLGLVGGDKVDLATNGGNYGVDTTVAGAEPKVGASIVNQAEADGGYLQYTLFNYSGTQKITVQKSAGQGSYFDGSLEVKAAACAEAGSYATGLGTSSGAVYKAISGTPQNLITLIPADLAWTGTGVADGAKLHYQVTGDPGVASVSVLYTLIATSI